MRRLDTFLVASIAIGALACAPAPVEDPSAATATTATADVELEPDDPLLVRRPFTADQIRAEWIPGLTLELRRSTPEGIQHERWTVVTADADSVEIEYQALDTERRPEGDARIARSSWIELRDHASFPAASARREALVRPTSLGMLDGWLYRVEDPAAGTVTELFFAQLMAAAIRSGVYSVASRSRSSSVRFSACRLSAVS
jgi:hypothetical protein